MSDLTAAQERAVRLALAAAHYRARAEHAEAVIARIQELADTDLLITPHELHQALTEGPR